MSVEVVVDRVDGQIVVRKRSTTPASAEDVDREAGLLSRLTHPGVATIVDLEHGPPAVLSMSFVGQPLSAMTMTSPEQATGIVASLATTVADLHASGVVHGRIDPSHVLIAVSGRPVLCGFRGAGTRGETPPVQPLADGFVDPAGTNELTTARDVWCLGRLLQTLLGGGVDVEPIPERRLRMLRRPRWSGYQRRAVLTLADQATADAPERRPSARALATAIREVMPTARLEPAQDDEDSSGPPQERPADRHRSRPPRARRTMAVAIAAAGLVLVALAALSFRGGQRPTLTADPLPASEVAETATTSSSTATSTVPSTASPSTTECQDATCDQPVVVGPGLVAVGETSYRIGAEGDEVYVGDWDCDGTTTAAVVRPSSGAVFFFSEWADGDAEVVVDPVAVLGPSTGGSVDDEDGDGCPDLVIDVAGSRIRVEQTGEVSEP